LPDRALRVRHRAARLKIALREEPARDQRGRAIKRLLGIDMPRFGRGHPGASGGDNLGAGAGLDQGGSGAALLRSGESGLRLAQTRRAINHQQHLPGSYAFAAPHQYAGDHAISRRDQLAGFVPAVDPSH
jgi:hypothetical protein